MNTERETKDDRPEVVQLLANIKAAMPELERLWEKVSDHWICEDKVYRFYHQSYKVFGLQEATAEIVEKLKSLAPKSDRERFYYHFLAEGREARTEWPILHPWFMQIVADGTGKQFKQEDNKNWLAITRPILEAFFHARYFIEMSIRYGKDLDEPPALLPSGWAAILYLYDLR